MTISQYLERFPSNIPVNVLGPFHRSGALAEPVLFIDRGVVNRIESEGVSVGDGDSSDRPMDIPLDPDKDCSDLAFALDCIPGRFTEVRLYGFLGGRRDHEYFNLGTAHRFLEKRSQPSVIRFEERIVGYTSGTWSFRRNGLFSIAALRDTRLTLQGACRYPCREGTAFGVLDSLGLSNQGSGDIHLENEGPVFVIFESEPGSPVAD